MTFNRIANKIPLVFLVVLGASPLKAQTFDTVQFMVPSGGGVGNYLTGYDVWNYNGLNTACWGGEPFLPCSNWTPQQPADKTYQLTAGGTITSLKRYQQALPVEEYTIGPFWINVYREQYPDWDHNTSYRYYNATKWVPRKITYGQPVTFSNPAVACMGSCGTPCSNWDPPFAGTTTVEVFQATWGELNNGNPLWVLKRHNTWGADVEDYYYGLGFGFVEYEKYHNGAFVQGTYRTKQQIDWARKTAPGCQQ